MLVRVRVHASGAFLQARFELGKADDLVRHRAVVQRAIHVPL
jgi:hypothetical protein